MTKTELQPSEGAKKAAEEINRHVSRDKILRDSIALAELIETTCHLRELEAVVEAARDDHHPSKTQGENHNNCKVCKSLATLDAAKEGK